MEIRLGKFLAECGIAARRKADDLIAQGRVQVNGKPAVLGQKVDPGRDRVTLDGKRVRIEDELITIMMNKPPGYVTTARDPEGRPTVLDLLPRGRARLFPVGRLDLLSEGLLLLTNDGSLSQSLTHPRTGIEKEYVVTVRPTATLEILGRMREGVRTTSLGVVRPLRIERLTPRKLSVTLTQGRKREIREMCEAAGLSVERLMRIRIGALSLGRLAPGEWRRLGDTDLRNLFRRPRG